MVELLCFMVASFEICLSFPFSFAFYLFIYFYNGIGKFVLGF